MPSSSLTGMKAPESPPTEELAMTPPFLTASFKSASAAVGGAVRAAGLEAHLLEYARDAVAHCGRRREGEVDDAEGHAEAAAGLLRDELAPCA